MLASSPPMLAYLNLVEPIFGVVCVIAIVLVYLFNYVFYTAKEDEALIIHRHAKPAEPEVSFTRAVLPRFLDKADRVDLSPKRIEISRSGREGMLCRDGIRADITITFSLRVNHTAEDVIKAASLQYDTGASTQQRLEETFHGGFHDALKAVGAQFDFLELLNNPDEFRDRLLSALDTDLSGYVITETVVTHLEQSPLSHLDEDNIVDAAGVRKAKKLAAQEDDGTDGHAREHG
ncbi:SPFH domain-containing protein [Salinactinospora qingdaonensis]|uniref:Band 7 domain-containing protein n=1 Tax=Salinactinospora qingdaonensis TaxID=702744 RepID=A0ABP7EWJ2_9ACTN